MQSDAVAFDRAGPHSSDFVLRRMRVEFTGEFYDRWLVHIEPNFNEAGVELEEAWVGLQLGPHRVMFGRMKEPFELEEMLSTRHVAPIYPSILNQFVPSEDHGITVNGTCGLLEYGVGLYNGTGGDDINSDKDVAARAVLHVLPGFQFGVAGTVGRERNDLSGVELKTEARVPWAAFLPGTVSDGVRWRAGVEAAYLVGPLAATGEITRRREYLDGDSVAFTGGYVQVAVMLTGEAATLEAVVPNRPFLREPDLGAWQLVARVSRLGLDDLDQFLTNSPRRIDSLTAGATWYANAFVKLKANYVLTKYSESIVVNGVAYDDENALMVEMQVYF